MSGGQVAEQGPAAVHQIGPGLVVVGRDHEKLLSVQDLNSFPLHFSRLLSTIISNIDYTVLLPTQVAVHGLSVRPNADGFQ